MTDFTEAVERLSAYDHEMYLGRLVWYTIAEQSSIDHSAFCHTLMANNLNVLPPVVRPSDVFKRACTGAQRRRQPTEVPNELMNYLIKEVGKDSDNIWRRLVAERVDTEGHRLYWTEVYELHFQRSTQHITVTPLVDSPAQAATNVIENVRANFTAWNNMLTPHAVRELVRRLLLNLNATIVRPSGGVYFVREEHYANVESLETVINGLPGSSFHSLPLVDDGKQREMLRLAFEDETNTEIDRMLMQMREIMQGDRYITSDQFAEMKGTFDYLKSKARDFSDLLDEALESTASRLEIMDHQLFELLGKVKV